MGNVPSTYERVEYIYRSGTSLAYTYDSSVTSLTRNEVVRTVFKFRPIAIYNTNFDLSMVNDNASYQISFGRNESTHPLWIKFNTSDWVNCPYDDTNDTILDFNNGNYTVKQGDSITTGTVTRDTTGNMRTIGFWNIQDSSLGDYQSRANSRFYYLKMYNASGDLLREYLPVKRISDNEYGIYETVTGNFLTNKLSGTSFTTDITATNYISEINLNDTTYKIKDENAVHSQYELPIATTSTLGGVIPDGTTITVDSTGKITSVGGGSVQQQSNWSEEDTTSVQYIQNKPDLAEMYVSDTKLIIDGDAESYNVPIATTSIAGKVKPDGTTITVASDGTITSVGGSGDTTFVVTFTYYDETSTSDRTVKEIYDAYKAGKFVYGLEYSSTSGVETSGFYNLVAASLTDTTYYIAFGIAGGNPVNPALIVYLYASGSEDTVNYTGVATTIAIATNSEVGLVKPDNSTITIDSDGIISSNGLTSVPNSSASTVGGIKTYFDSTNAVLYITNDGSDPTPT